MARGDWDAVNWWHFAIALSTSAGMGMIKLLQAIAKGRKIRKVDIVLEPSLAIAAGMLVWGVLELSGMPEVFRTVLVSLAAWGGPHTIRKLEIKYLGTVIGETAPVPLKEEMK